MDYKDTLLMPKTKFPMRGNLPNKEPERQQNGMKNKFTIKGLSGQKDVHCSFCMMDRHMPMVICISGMLSTKF